MTIETRTCDNNWIQKPETTAGGAHIRETGQSWLPFPYPDYGITIIENWEYINGILTKTKVKYYGIE